MPKRTISACLCSLLCLFLAAPGAALASAADPKIEDQTAMAALHKKKAPSVEIKAGVVGMAGVENGPAEMGYSDFRVTARYKGFDAGYELRNYRWGRTDGLPFAPGWQDPFNNMHTVRLGYQRTGRFNRTWGWRAYGRLSSSFEDDILGSPTALLGAGLSYSATRDLILMAGLFGSYNEADQFFLPFVGLIYRPGATDGFSGSLGFPFSRLNYHLTKKLTLTMRTGFIRRTYKLADDNPVVSKGDFRTKEFSGGLSASYAITKRWQATVGADYLFQREISFFEDGGKGGVDYDLENTWGGWARLSFSF